MTPAQTRAANDELRQHYKGGRIEVCHGPYQIDDGTLGRMLCVLRKYDKFTKDSLRDSGTFIFAGYQCEWTIQTVDDERVLRVWVQRDVLQEALMS